MNDDGYISKSKSKLMSCFENQNNKLKITQRSQRIDQIDDIDYQAVSSSQQSNDNNNLCYKDQTVEQLNSKKGQKKNTKNLKQEIDEDIFFPTQSHNTSLAVLNSLTKIDPIDESNKDDNLVYPNQPTLEQHVQNFENQQTQNSLNSSKNDVIKIQEIYDNKKIQFSSHLYHFHNDIQEFIINQTGMNNDHNEQGREYFFFQQVENNNKQDIIHIQQRKLLYQDPSLKFQVIQQKNNLALPQDKQHINPLQNINQFELKNMNSVHINTVQKFKTQQNAIPQQIKISDLQNLEETCEQELEQFQIQNGDNQQFNKNISLKQNTNDKKMQELKFNKSNKQCPEIINEKNEEEKRNRDQEIQFIREQISFNNQQQCNKIEGQYNYDYINGKQLKKQGQTKKIIKSKNKINSNNRFQRNLQQQSEEKEKFRKIKKNFMKNYCSAFLHHLINIKSKLEPILQDLNINVKDFYNRYIPKNNKINNLNRFKKLFTFVIQRQVSSQDFKDQNTITQITEKIQSTENISIIESQNLVFFCEKMLLRKFAYNFFRSELLQYTNFSPRLKNIYHFIKMKNEFLLLLRRLKKVEIIFNTDKQLN